MRKVASVTTPNCPSEPQTSRRIEIRAAKLDHGAIHQHHGHAHQVVGGHAVSEAMRAARIHRDIAADGTGKLRRGIGRVEETLRLHRAGDGKIGAPGLHADEAVVEIGFQHRGHSRHTKDHAVGRGQRPARKRGAGAARHHGHTHLVTDRQRVRHLLRGRGQDRGHGRAPVGGERVAFIGARFRRVRDHRVGGQDRAQARHELGLARQDRGVRRGHLHGASPRIGVIV
jgi:hypothetical protein